MFGVSCHGRSQAGVTGIRPVLTSCQRTSQWPKFGKTHHRARGDAQHLAQHDARLLHRLKRARQHHVVECAVRIVREVGVGIAMHHRHAVRHRADHLGHVDLDAARVAAFGARQMIDQHAVAAADVEHARAGRDHLGDQPEIDAHVLGDEADGVVSCHVGRRKLAGGTGRSRGRGDLVDFLHLGLCQAPVGGADVGCQLLGFRGPCDDAGHAGPRRQPAEGEFQQRTPTRFGE